MAGTEERLQSLGEVGGARRVLKRRLDGGALRLVQHHLEIGIVLCDRSALACCVSAIAVQTVGNRPVGLDQVKHFVRQHNVLTDAI